jgi:hypothetical protein
MIYRIKLYYFLRTRIIIQSATFKYFVVSHIQFQGRIWNSPVNNFELSSSCILPGYCASET